MHFRINPDLSSESHPYIQTGLKTSKFGVLKEKVVSWPERLRIWSVNLKDSFSCWISNFDKELKLENLNLLIEISTHLISKGIT
ncbi:MAG: hypothetical protein CM1200mP12_22870 [Gammaproteobacteria bacterium]|nr:MAG: hypothetical protein CM1200mP12_22870 [Gammaproteobacteria bacterium]